MKLFKHNILYPTIKSPVIHRIGNVYRIRGEYCILSQVDFLRVSLLPLNSGSYRWEQPVLCKNKFDITDKEMTELTALPKKKIKFIGRINNSKLHSKKTYHTLVLELR